MTRQYDRAPGELRPTEITPHYLLHAEGSVLIEVGLTRVICAASVEERVPPFLRGTGKGWVTAEYGMLPRATTTRSTREASSGKVGGRTMEIQRLIGRSMRSVVRLNDLGRAHRLARLRRHSGRRRDPDRLDHGRVRGAGSGARSSEADGGPQDDAGWRLRCRDQCGYRRRHAAPGPRLRRRLQGRRGHEHRQDRGRTLHRGAGDRGVGAVRSHGAGRAAGAGRRRHRRADREAARRSSDRSSADDGCLLATTNPNKVREIRPLFAGADVELMTLADVAPVPEPAETASSFWENARQKALATRGRPGSSPSPRTRGWSSIRCKASQASGRHGFSERTSATRRGSRRSTRAFRRRPARRTPRGS